MKTLENAIAEYFPQEKIENIYSATLKVETNKVFNIPLSYFKDPKIDLYRELRIAKTDNYWFVDLRYRIRPMNRILAVAAIAIFFIYFGNQFMRSDIWFLSGILTLFVTYFFIYVFFAYRGLFINVYERTWVQERKDNNMLNLNITQPKYSKNAIWKVRYGNTIFDFLGLTISSAEVKSTYSFEII